MKIVYPSPPARTGMLDYIHKLQSRLAQRTRGHSRMVRSLRCNTKYFVVRMLDKVEQLFS